MIMPRLGDAVGNFFFQPNQEVEKDPHSSAAAAVARGDYEAAVEEYRQILEKDPTDTLSYSEIAKISCEHLDDSLGASALLEQALQREWSPEDAAFLSTRLIDVYWKYQHDACSARALLVQIIENMPGTRHAANAEHRLREIEQQITLEG
jgi:tetratricopeptide (TPR) repeat protein